ncbi:hypothetical protein PTTG_28661 [Puccinia triticina 1-1 BBBD Race 1]|uniref:Superoxide dismutase copper/zinc binding domain-containing protein n=2 Tax=Puccinia triticina TaxID=208348 RepID=A0A180GAS3_PUCT1|nr:uncharacterized protein PtA15_3A854 [Puccinia triticina]OAV89548.1 hypothetical protein PTTG_28661 [Puccinia triticina 1-1 BBBD Race 1]WAQ83483.1 hypothetical protein PtA15_3A854 [Puccinia triticina]WAR54321.1 hypothetical protein PtB15_3B835 [Puccinia triticina]
MFYSKSKWILVGLLAAIVDLSSAHPAGQPPSTPKYPTTAKATLNAKGFEAVFTFLLLHSGTSLTSLHITGYATVPFPLTGVHLTYSGVPDGQDFDYSIHEKPIAHGDEIECKDVGDLWNPTKSTYKGSDEFKCKPEQPAYCESGNLSGKHRKLKHIPDSNSNYFDPSLRFGYSELGIFGKSIVVYDPTGTPVTCATIVPHDP